MKTKEALVFGAGNIGRGFLGDLLNQSEYHINFVDVDNNKVNLINQERNYTLITVSSDKKNERKINSVNAIYFQDSDKIKTAVIDADIILTAVGKNALEYVAKPLAEGLLKRLKQRPNDELHTIVLACENVQDNTAYLKEKISKYLTGEETDLIENNISFPNCVVDRIVPNTTFEGLNVIVEEYFQFVIDANVLKDTFPDIKGIILSSNLNSILEQKLFTLNMAHALTAYYGYLKKFNFIHEAVSDNNIRQLLNGSLEEVSSVILERNSSITAQEQIEYSNKIVKRFENPYLKDEITRVARDPKRKLSKDDRLIKPARLSYEKDKLPVYLATGIAAALHYDYTKDSQAVEIVNSIKERGLEIVLKEITGLGSNKLLDTVKSNYLFRSL